MLPACGPSSTASSTAVTVTGCATFQFVASNVSDGGATESCASGDTVMVTVPVGWLVSCIVYESVAPPSATDVVPPDCRTVTPRTSLSVMPATTFATGTP